MTTYYKLTDQDNKTANNTLWGEGVTHTAKGRGKELCSADVIHVYAHPLLSVLFNPIHADIQNPKLWECQTTQVVNQDAFKIGVKSCTTTKEIPLPRITMEQRASFAIRCAKLVNRDKKWNKWADDWLSGKDRTYVAADAAGAAAADAADAAARAAGAAARAAIDFVAIIKEVIEVK